MNKFWQTYKPVFQLFLIWRLVLAIDQYFSGSLFPIRVEYLGLYSPWANLDGEHYISIARAGYQIYNVAFFPLYPLIVNLFAGLRPEYLTNAGIFVSHICFFIGLLLFYKLVLPSGRQKALWSILFLLVFPTSFFFAAVYSESLYFMLSVVSVYLLTKKHWVPAGLVGMLASATRVFGVLLTIPYGEVLRKMRKKRSILPFIPLFFIPLGLLFYMVYLYARSGDPFSFFHIQPAFGAGRTGGQLILLPQVLWRYAKIVYTAQIHEFVYWIAVLELATLIGSFALLWIGYKKKIQSSLLLYSGALILLPTLTGTLSSLPRYVLSAFPLFIILGTLHNRWIKYGLLCIFVVLQVILTTAFLQGYFVG